MDKKLKGKQGEELAITYLKKRGYRIVARNYHKRSGEIDIIAFDPKANEYVFCEVKMRLSNAFGYPEESVTPEKIRKIMETAYNWFEEKNIITDNFRIDVIAIQIKKTQPDIKHLKNIAYDQ